MSLTDTGLTTLTAVEIEDAIIAALKDPSVFGPGLKIGAESPIRQIISAVAIQLGSVYELLQETYEALDPDSASGDQLERACALSAITREGATKSTTTLRYSGTNYAPIPTGTVARIPGGSSWVTIEGGSIPKSADLDLAAEALETGPTEALSGTITEQVTIISGVSAVTNIADAIVGRDIESDLKLRRRREAGLAVSGSGTDASTAASLRELNSVDQAIVISNRSSTTDSYGIPEHASRPIIWPAAQTTEEKAKIFAVLWGQHGGGLKLDGTVTGTVVDSQGNSQPVAYSPASEQEVHLEIVIVTDPLTYGGDDAVRTAALAATADPLLGASLLLWRIENRVTDDVTGITEIEVRALVGSAPTSGDTASIVATLAQILTVDSANVDVTSS